MKIPELQNPKKYEGLYIVDFGDTSSVGFTAPEVAEIVESQRYRHAKIYKIHRAYPDGRMELKGIPRQTFETESGMFFYSDDQQQAKQNFDQLVKCGIENAPPCRAKVHLAQYDDDRFITALIYPAEYEDEISSWLLDTGYIAQGPAQGGSAAVERYYQSRANVISRHQLFAQSNWTHRTGQDLYNNLKKAVQR